MSLHRYHRSTNTPSPPVPSFCPFPLYELTRGSIDIVWPSDHRPVPARLTRPFAEPVAIVDQGEDADQCKAEADHRHCNEGVLHTDRLHHGIDVEGYRERDYVFQAAYKRECVRALGEIWIG